MQKHSEYHAKSFDKKNADEKYRGPRNCRFPRPVSETVTRPGIAAEKLKTALLNCDERQSSTLLRNPFNILQRMIYKAYSKRTKNKSIVLLRKTHDVWINQYNLELPFCWQAITDFQISLTILVYIVSSAKWWILQWWEHPWPAARPTMCLHNRGDRCFGR